MRNLLFYLSFMFMPFNLTPITENIHNSGYSGSGHNHRTSTACFNNKVAKNRTRNKISRESRKNNQ